MIIISGPDRIDFLQRLTTNNLARLAGDQAIITILCNPQGRILDILTVYETENHLHVLTLPARGQETTTFFKNRIFFMDKVDVQNESAAFLQYQVQGPHLEKILAALSMREMLQKHTRNQITIEGYEVNIVGRIGGEDNSVRLVAPAQAQTALATVLNELGVKEMSSLTHEILQVESGIGSVKNELTEEYTPLEIGLADFVARDKGCFPGQEVLARQLSYDKITRHLVGIMMEKDPGKYQRLKFEGGNIGQMTTSVNSPRFGHIGLAVVRRPYHEIGTSVELFDKHSETVIPASIVALPFEK